MLLSFGGNEDGQCGRHDFKSEDEEEGYGSEFVQTLATFEDVTSRHVYVLF